MNQSNRSANRKVILFAAGLIVLGILIRIFYTGYEVDGEAVSSFLGTSKRGNALSIAVILLMKFFASSAGYITLLVVGSLILLLSIPGKNKDHE